MIQNTLNELFPDRPVRKAGSESLQHQGILADSDEEILVGDSAIFIIIHFLDGHVNQILHALLLPLVLHGAVLDLGQAVPHHGQHLLSADEAVVVEIVDSEAVEDLLG